MRSRIRRVATAAFLLALVCMRGAAFAAPPPDLSFQGQLLDGTGSPLVGPVDLELRIFDQPVDGASLYAEAHLGLALDEGGFTILIGTGSDRQGVLDATLFSEMSRWLELVVDGEVLAPRQAFSSVAYALQSQQSQSAVFAATAGDADRLGGVEAAALDQSAHVGASGNPHGVTAADVGAASVADIDAAVVGHASDASAHHAKTTSFAELLDQIAEGQIPDAITRDSEIAGLQAQITSLQDDNAALGLQVASLEAANAGLGAQLAGFQASLDDLVTRFAGVSRSGDLLTFEAMNVRVTNGAGSTTTENGLGNLIVGYDEAPPFGPADRSGSHNFVLGTSNSYSSHAGLVGGTRNSISAPFASVLTGASNVASAEGASVSGGAFNEASGLHASVSGGEQNTASGEGSSVSGGDTNTASSFRSSAFGGQRNVASGPISSVTGGVANEASGPAASVSGGDANVAVGTAASVSGGRNGQALGDWSAISGGGGSDPAEGNVAHAHYSSVVGGRSNTTGVAADPGTGEASTVSGGRENTASGFTASVVGGRNNRALGEASSIAGGGGGSSPDGNIAYAIYSAILGGARNETGSDDSTSGAPGATVSGGSANRATGGFSSVSGGTDNLASAFGSSVSGGIFNEARGSRASIAGGRSNEATNSHAAVSGGEGNSANGRSSTVSGGEGNRAVGTGATVSGGANRTSFFDLDWRAGSLFEDD
ncbi:MAG: hypothetical protein QNK05_13620 [Myxococcota bacterium]|nr:hypothetical protein [Myxococcota bacterium]